MKTYTYDSSKLNGTTWEHVCGSQPRTSAIKMVTPMELPEECASADSVELWLTMDASIHSLRFFKDDVEVGRLFNWPVTFKPYEPAYSAFLDELGVQPVGV